ncbi:unnamed protein product [Amoebophrya sp. A25]|nr:unnamed protein product [Amoebophrya sp. A25]|eukprot:GSA25T00012495001.1
MMAGSGSSPSPPPRRRTRPSRASALSKMRGAIVVAAGLSVQSTTTRARQVVRPRKTFLQTSTGSSGAPAADPVVKVTCGLSLCSDGEQDSTPRLRGGSVQPHPQDKADAVAKAASPRTTGAGTGGEPKPDLEGVAVEEGGGGPNAAPASGSAGSKNIKVKGQKKQANKNIAKGKKQALPLPRPPPRTQKTGAGAETEAGASWVEKRAGPLSSGSTKERKSSFPNHQLQGKEELDASIKES